MQYFEENPRLPYRQGGPHAAAAAAACPFNAVGSSHAQPVLPAGVRRGMRDSAALGAGGQG